MIGLDTNVLVRYIAQDDKKQSAQAAAIIGAFTSDAPGFISTVCLVETVWVMQGCYHATKQDIIKILEALFRAKELVVENSETAIRALRVFSTSNSDFADCLIERSGNAVGCQYTWTFDATAAKIHGMKIVAVR